MEEEKELFDPENIDLKKPLEWRRYLEHKKHFTDNRLGIDTKQFARCLIILDIDDHQRKQVLMAAGGDDHSTLACLVFVPKEKYEKVVAEQDRLENYITLMHVLTPATIRVDNTPLDVYPLGISDDMRVHLLPLGPSSERIARKTYWFSSIPLRSNVALENSDEKIHKFYKLDIVCLESKTSIIN